MHWLRCSYNTKDKINMIVKELIEQLLKMPQEAEVNACYDTAFSCVFIDIKKIQINEFDPNLVELS